MSATNNQSFSNFLRRFALAIDVVEASTLAEVGELARRYVNEGLEIDFFEVMHKWPVEGQPGLKTLWRSEEGHWTQRLRDENGEPSTQMAWTVVHGRPLWVVPPDETTPLHECDAYADLWSGVEELPAYRRGSQSVEPTTSIIVPLQRHGRAVGAMCLESPRYIECTDIAKHELEVLAETLTVLYEGQEAREQASQSTSRALGELNDILDEVPFPSATRPQLFLASAANADEDVVGSIKSVLKEFSSRLQFVHWRYDFQEAVFVDQQLMDAIEKSKFGICYLSEPFSDPEDGAPRFFDNQNVIFEAGMLHALTYTQQPGGWIPVREHDSPDAPFDIRNLQMVLVPRGDDGRLNVERFHSDLRARIAQLAGEEA